MSHPYPNILIVMALPIENVAGALDRFAEVLYTGVGKVNAALHLTARLAQSRPDVVINVGSAGAHQRPTGAVVACTQFIQRDMDVTALGFAWGQTPFEAYNQLDAPLPLSWQALSLPEAVCYTGDQFVTGPHPHFALDVVDMEGYALARVCQHFAVPLVSIKYITDGADGQAATEWEQALAQATTALVAVMAQWQGIA
jgi:adenosylhomocysteine nucleosidase